MSSSQLHYYPGKGGRRIVQFGISMKELDRRGFRDGDWEIVVSYFCLE